MNRTIRFATGVVSAGLAVLMGLQSAYAAGATQTRTPAPAMVNPCTGEILTTTGSVHTVTVSHTGHFMSHQNFQGVKGTSPVTGTRYGISGTIALRFNAHKAVNVTQTSALRVIAPHGGLSFHGASFEHIVVTPRFRFRTTTRDSSVCK